MKGIIMYFNGHNQRDLFYFPIDSMGKSEVKQTCVLAVMSLQDVSYK